MLYRAGRERPAQLIPAAEFPFRIPLLIALSDRLSFIGEFLSPANAELEFHETLLQVYFQRHQRESALIDLSPDPRYFLLVNKEFPLAVGIVVENRSVLVWGDMKTDEPQLAVPDTPVGI